MPLSPKWGPFDGPHQASTRLAKYVDESLDPTVGIAWSSLGELTPYVDHSMTAVGLATF